MEDRTDWERATRQQRQLAVAADAELRRHHPGQRWDPMRSAEPEPQREGNTPAQDLGETSRLIEDLAAQHREFTGKLAERQSVMIPAEDLDFGNLGPAFRAWTALARDAILQPPKPQIEPSERILELVADRDAGMEAADRLQVLARPVVVGEGCVGVQGGRDVGVGDRVQGAGVLAPRCLDGHAACLRCGRLVQQPDGQARIPRAAAVLGPGENGGRFGPGGGGQPQPGLIGQGNDDHGELPGGTAAGRAVRPTGRTLWITIFCRILGRRGSER